MSFELKRDFNDEISKRDKWEQTDWEWNKRFKTYDCNKNLQKNKSWFGNEGLAGESE
jgi:hypothetical protein